MYYTVLKRSGHLRTLEKCSKHSPAARVVYISLVFSNARRVLSQCNTRLRLLYLLSKGHQRERRNGMCFCVCIISMTNQCHQLLISAFNDYRKRDKLRPNGPLGLFADFTVRTFLLSYYMFFFSQFIIIWSIV